MPKPNFVTAIHTIEGGATGLSGTFTATSGSLVAIGTPSDWTTAAITFQGSWDGSNFFDLRLDDASGTELSISSSAADAAKEKIVVFADDMRQRFHGIPYLKFRSGTAASPVNQTTTKTLQIILRQD